MKRKIIKLGNSTLVTSLPSKWIKKYNLKQGDEVNLQEEENRLVISKELTKIKKETDINLANQTESTIRFLIINLYRTGYDKITIHFKNETQFQILNQAMKEYLIGFDVITKKADFCVIENITEPSADQFEIILQKILYNIKAMIEITIERLKTKKVSADYNEIIHKIHQYDNFCRRTITKENKNKAVFFWSFLSLIIHSPRELYHLNMLLDKKNKNTRISKETIDLLKEGLDLLQLIIKAYQKKDTKPLEEVHEKEKKLIQVTGHKLLRKEKGEEDIILHYILTSIRNLYLSTSPLMGLLV